MLIRKIHEISICLGLVNLAFTQSYRNIIRLDGFHLKGPFDGQLLAIVGIDDNVGMFTVEWAVVEEPLAYLKKKKKNLAIILTSLIFCHHGAETLIH